MSERRHISVVDSHTGGEPTRVVISGGPDLGKGPLSERRELFAKEHDRFRSAVVNEPRGSDAVVGALLFVGIPLALALISQQFVGGNVWQTYVMEHVTLILGPPLAIAAAFALVLLFFPDLGGAVTIKFLSLELSGPAGPILFWAICFLSIIFSLWLLSGVDLQSAK